MEATDIRHSLVVEDEFDALAIETQVPDSLHVGAAKKYPGGWPLAHTCIISRCAFLPVGTDLDTLVGMQLFTSLTPWLVVYAPL